MKRLAVLIICLGLIAIPAYAEGASFAFSPGLVQGVAGRTSISLGFSDGRFPESSSGFSGTIVRGIAPRLDIAAYAAGGGLDLEARLLAVDLPPLGLLIAASFRGFSGVLRLSLGPVRLELARSWGRDGGRRLTVGLFPAERFFLIAGWEQRNKSSSAFFGLRVNPGEYALWGGFLVLSLDHLTFGIGGAF